MFKAKVEYVVEDTKKIENVIVDVDNIEEVRNKVGEHYPYNVTIKSINPFKAEKYNLGADSIVDNIWKGKVRTTIVDEVSAKEKVDVVTFITYGSCFDDAVANAEEYVDGFACGADIIGIDLIDYIYIK